MSHYHANRDKICAKRRRQYATDTKYRAKIKQRARDHRNSNIESYRANRIRAYWKDPVKARQRSLAWYHANREKMIKDGAVRRKKNQVLNRALACWNSFNLTDSYVRNQLSKYSDHSTHEWTPEQVEAKRRVMLLNRAKKITPEKVLEIRTRYISGERMDVIAKSLGVSTGTVHLTVKNRLHVDDHYVPPVRSSQLFIRLAKDAELIARELQPK